MWRDSRSLNVGQGRFIFFAMSLILSAQTLSIRHWLGAGMT